MLFDVGSQDDARQATLLQYLNDFFARRSDLNRTIDLVLISHHHIDHTRSLREVVEAFTVRRYIDNGFTTGERRRRSELAPWRGRGGPSNRHRAGDFQVRRLRICQRSAD